MNIFVTGGTGFIGSYFIAEAIKAGHKVTALRRKSDSNPVIPLPCEPSWISGDLHSLTTSHFIGVDAVVHLASAGVSPKQACLNELISANVLGSFHVVETAATAGVSRFVIAGTSHEYGQAAERYSHIPPDSPLEPVNPYGASKAAAFQLLRAIAIQKKLELFYARIFTAYGDGQFQGNFWPSLKKAALNGEHFPMTSGNQISDFIPVYEVACHLLEGCTRTDIQLGTPLVVNIGSGKAMSLLSFAHAEWTRLKAKGFLLPSALPDRADQIQRYVPDLVGLSITSSN